MAEIKQSTSQTEHRIGTRSPLLLQDRNPLLHDRNPISPFSSKIGTPSLWFDCLPPICVLSVSGEKGRHSKKHKSSSKDPNNKNVVNCDEKLRSILLGEPQVELAELPTLIKLHFPK